jgi:hypothetical protein
MSLTQSAMAEFLFAGEFSKDRKDTSPSKYLFISGSSTVALVF